MVSGKDSDNPGCTRAIGLQSDANVLITGAGGFVGGRIAEVLHLAELARVKACVHRWSNAARIGRFPLDIFQTEVLDEDVLRSAMEDTDFVVHCAYGNEDVTKKGTRNVLNVALEKGIKRVVHFSTIEVYGNVSGEVKEGQPLEYSGKPYADSKIEAEKICREYQRKGLSTVILRPTIIYGPFGEAWSIGLARKLVRGPLGSHSRFAGLVNPVYVDDVVSAAILALSEQEADGEAFNIGGPETVTWGKFFEQFEAALGVRRPQVHSFLTTHMISAIIHPLRLAGRKAVNSYPEAVSTSTARYAFLKTAARKVREVIETTPSLQELELFRRKADYRIDKAKRILGYTPSFDLSTGLDLTSAWLEHLNYFGSGSPGA